VIRTGADAFTAADTLVPVEYDEAPFLHPQSAHGAGRNAGGFCAVVTGPGIISEPGSAVGLEALPRFKGTNPAEILARPEIVFVLAGHLTGLAGNTAPHIKIKSQFSHIPYLPYTFTKRYDSILHINPLIIIRIIAEDTLLVNSVCP
jgi:hypothetical protein